METEETKEVTDIHPIPKLNLAALKAPQYTALKKEVLHL